VAPLGVAATVDGGRQAWLNDVWSPVVRRLIGDGSYYGDTLWMLSMLVMPGNGWSPAALPY